MELQPDPTNIDQENRAASVDLAIRTFATAPEVLQRIDTKEIPYVMCMLADAYYHYILKAKMPIEPQEDDF